MATIGEQYLIAHELGITIASRGVPQQHVAEQLGVAMRSFGVDPVEIPTWAAVEAGYGQSERVHTPSSTDVLFRAAVATATEGILIRESADFEPNRAGTSAYHLQGVVNGTAVVDFDPRVTHRLVRSAIVTAMEPLEHRSSYTAIASLAHLQSVMNEGEFGNLGTAIRDVRRRVRAIRLYGADVYAHRE